MVEFGKMDLITGYCGVYGVGMCVRCLDAGYIRRIFGACVEY